MSLVTDMLAVQEINRQKAGADHALRTLHAKIVVAIGDARLIMRHDLPQRFAVGHFQPGASLPAVVRFSNASGVPSSDALPDMRGAAIRLTTPDGGIHDLLLTSFPVSHARNARQFVAFAVMAAGDRSQLVARMKDAFGEREADRMMANIQQAARPSGSLATESYWSRGAILWGDAGPARFQLRPLAASAASSRDQGPNQLRAEFAGRLRAGDVRFRFALQEFVSEEITPIEDGAVEWTEAASPPTEIGALILPSHDILNEAGDHFKVVDAMAFNPWNAPPQFRPLGNLNRARRSVYAASAQRWR
jgi:catalase